MTNTFVMWTVRFLAAAGVLVCGFALAALFAGASAAQLPVVLPGAPFGTYAQNTQLGVFTLGAGFALAFVGAALAFRWERLAAKLLIAAAVVQGCLWLVALQDTTRPDGLKGVVMSILIFALPPLVTGLLLLVHSRAEAPAIT